jgi:pentatricopeptide repeat protein
MKFMGKSLNPVKAIEIYNGIHDESAKNNVFICNSVLSCLVRNGKFERSINLFQQMKINGLMPDAVTYSTVGHFTSYYEIPNFLLASVNTSCSSDLELLPHSAT